MGDENRKLKIYLSSALFSHNERAWNRSLALSLSQDLDGAEVILPQDFRIDGKFNDAKTFGSLFKKCVSSVAECDVVVAILDGADIDSGTAFEVGFAYAKNIPVIGVRTDYREGQDKGVNLMLAESCLSIVREYSFTENVSQLSQNIAKRIKKYLKKE